MSSVTTNAAALGALTVLSGINKQLQTAQEQVSSGYRVETASDDPTYWSIANTMKSDSDSLSTVQDALGLASGKVDTMYTAMQSSVDLLSQIRDKLVTASEPGVDRDTLNQDITSFKAQLVTAAQSASFSGDNWLYNSDAQVNTTKSVISNFTRGTAGQVYLSSITYDGSDALLVDTADASRGLLTANVDANTINSDGTSTARNYYLLTATGGTPPADGTEISISDTTTDQQLSDMMAVVNSLLTSLTSATSKMGVMQSNIDGQSDFLSSLITGVKTSIGDFIDTDMEPASARVAALQTAQQMGIQSISIANTMASKVLILLQTS